MNRDFIATMLRKWRAVRAMRISVLTGIFALALQVTAFPQARVISGIVTSQENAQPIPGVNIVVEGTTIGAVSDAQGKYTLSVPPSATTLIFSFIGYKTESVAIGNQTEISMQLTADIRTLGEVVVTAFGIEKEKKAIGFATQELSTKDLTDARDVNVANYLTGKVAGVQVGLSASGVGGSSKVTIRGFSSLTGENQPLYVVDGFPLDNTKYGEGEVYTNGRDFGDGIGNINPQDIESINVLKGPNATALYGSRGANGVILITTKSGKVGKGIAVEINSNVTIDKLNLFPKLQNKYMTGYEDLNLYGNTVNINGTDYLDIPSWHYESMGPPMDGRLLVNPFVYPGTDPTTFKLLPQPENNVRDFFETGVVTNNSVAVSGGTEKSSARLSVNNMTIKGIVPNHKEDQQSVTLRALTNVTDKLSFEGKANYVHKNTDNPPGLGVFSANNVVNDLAAMGRYVPMDFLKEYYEKTGEAGSWPGVSVNPYYLVNENKDNAERDRIISFVSAKYQFTSWLNLMARSGIDFYSERRIQKRPVGSPNGISGRLVDQTFLTKESNSDVLLTAAKDNLARNFSGTLSLGASISKRSYRQQGWEGTDFKVPDIYHVSNARNVIPSYSFVSREIQSVYASGELGFKNYLFLDVTGRNDWSSTLGENNYSFFYPSVSASFIFTDAFNIHSRILSLGKLRASYAEAGNDGAAYLTQSGYTLDSTPFNGQSLAYQSNTIALFDLKNELKKSVEFGADLRFLGDRVGLDVTYYKSNTENQIVPITVSAASGYTTKIVNAGNIENKGIELTLRATPVQLQNGLNWDLSFNYARNQSTVIELAPGIETFFLNGTAQAAQIEARTGERFGNIVGYKYKRAPDGQIIVAPDGSYMREDDMSILGNITPKWIGGLNNTINFKGLSLNFLIDFVQGNEITSDTKYRMIANGTAKFTEQYREHSEPLPGVVEVTDEDGNVTYAPNTTLVDGQTAWSTRAWGQISEEFVLDGSFIMLREVVLGYSFKPSLLQKTPFNAIRLSIVGRNLWYIEEHMQDMGISPETNLNTRAGTTGVEVFSLPTTRSYGLNLNLTF
jgi:TonB-linked SusC/RagA family outer membrane protein